MRIGIDISQIVHETGVSTYTKNLVENLLKIDKVDEYVLFGGSLRGLSKLKSAMRKVHGKYRLMIFPIPPTLADFLWNRLHFFSTERLIGKIDVFHSSDWTQPPSKAFKITTIHDLVPIKFPELSHPRIVAAQRMRLNHVKKEVDRIIVPSRQTREDLVADGFNENKIRVIPEAPDPIYKPAKKPEIDKVKRKYRIEGRYLIAVGASPRKNTKRIIEAYEEIGHKEGLKLVIIGELAEKIRKTSQVLSLGHIPTGELPALYSGAEVLVYPSLYEGFGLPILEAFRCKIPVVASNLGSMKEICENIAVLVNPESSDSIGAGILKALKERDSLVKKGITKVRNFSWEKTAIKTLEVYQEGGLIISR